MSTTQSEKVRREVDEAVSVRLFGFKPWEQTPDGFYRMQMQGDFLYFRGPRHYSTDIADAWAVVEEMARRDFTCDVEWKGADREYAHTAEVSFRQFIFTAGHAVADSPALAICRAALMALDAEPRAVPASGTDGQGDGR